MYSPSNSYCKRLEGAGLAEAALFEADSIY